MTARYPFLLKVRGKLNDTSANPVWSDALLETFIDDGLVRLSVDWPAVQQLTLAAVAGQRDYPIDPAAYPVGPGGIMRVEYPVGSLVPPGNTAIQYLSLLGGSGDGLSFGQCWEFLRQADEVNPQLLRFRYGLAPAEADSIGVTYYGYYSLAADDDAVLQVSGLAEQALKWAVCARAMSWLEQQRGKRQGGNGTSRDGTAGYYLRLYQETVAKQQTARGILSSKVVVDG